MDSDKMQDEYRMRAMEHLHEMVLESGLGIVVDTSGYTYVTGFTESPNFPTTPGALQTALNGPRNAFLSVINTSAIGAAALVYSTYLGGSCMDAGFSVATDNVGNAYITGYTGSPDFPVTPGAFQNMLRGNQNAFLAVINTKATGAAALVYSTYLGGSDSDTGLGIVLDTTGNTYITGFTGSHDFPTTSGAYQTMLAGMRNAFVSIIDTGVSGAAALSYSTYLGGNSYDEAHGIDVDITGNIYITGLTYSTNFPVTSGVFQSTLNSTHGGANAFVSKLNATVSGAGALLYSTYLGGSISDQGYAIASDAANNAYVTGWTCSNNFPVTTTAFQSSLLSACCGTNAFVTKINTAANGERGLVYSTYLGGTGHDEGRGIAIDTASNAYVTGFTDSTNFPVTASAFQPVLKSFHAEHSNAFISEINTNGTGNASLVYSTFLGGCDTDAGNAIALDQTNNTYVAGRTGSPDFPVTPGAFQTTLSGQMSAFITEISTVAFGPASLIYSTYLGC